MVIRLFLCIFLFSTLLYFYIDEQNRVTKLRLELPRLTQQLAKIEQENTQLVFEIDRFENPSHLLEIAKKSEFRHLKYPTQDEVIELKKES